MILLHTFTIKKAYIKRSIWIFWKVLGKYNLKFRKMFQYVPLITQNITKNKSLKYLYITVKLQLRPRVKGPSLIVMS